MTTRLTKEEKTIIKEAIANKIPTLSIAMMDCTC